MVLEAGLGSVGSVSGWKGERTGKQQGTVSGDTMSLLEQRPSAPVAPCFLLVFEKSQGVKLLLHLSMLALICLAFPYDLRADTISGTVKDPSGAVVVNARIEITGNGIPQPIILVSDELGRFSAPNLLAGKYSVRVAKEGFEELITPVDLHDTANIELKLTIATQQTSVNVTEKSTGFGNSDPAYRQLRDDGLGNTYHCEKFTLSLNVGTFH